MAACRKGWLKLFWILVEGVNPKLNPEGDRDDNDDDDDYGDVTSWFKGYKVLIQIGQNYRESGTYSN